MVDRQLKLELEQRLKAREGKLARLARSHKRKDASGSTDDDARLKERIFIQVRVPCHFVSKGGRRWEVVL